MTPSLRRWRRTAPWSAVAAAVLFLACTLIAGCSRGPARARPPEVDPEAAAQRAFELYDKNADGDLDETELAAVPGIRAELDDYDANADKKINKQELVDRIAEWKESTTGLSMLNCVILLDGQPLEGARVRLVPEPFLGVSFHAAETITRNNGEGILKIPDADLPSNLQGTPGVTFGIYKVEVTHPETQIPARYNANTELGLDLSPGAREFGAGRFTLRLTTRS